VDERSSDAKGSLSRLRCLCWRQAVFCFSLSIFVCTTDFQCKGNTNMGQPAVGVPTVTATMTAGEAAQLPPAPPAPPMAHGPLQRATRSTQTQEQAEGAVPSVPLPLVALILGTALGVACERCERRNKECPRNYLMFRVHWALPGHGEGVSTLAFHLFISEKT